MGFFDRLFGKNSPRPGKGITGGDGLTPRSAAKLDCSSMGMGKHLIDSFISQKHGRKDSEWTATLEYFVKEKDIPEYSIRAYGITLQNGERKTYYFDVSRPHGNEMNIAKKMGLLPDNID